VGGGLAAYLGSGTLEIEDSRFADNSARDGGAINLETLYTAGNSTVSITNSKVTGNTANRSGGGIWGHLANPVSVTISDTIVSGNQAYTDGGCAALYIPYNNQDGGVATGETVTFSRVTISGNKAGGAGGGVTAAIGSSGQLAFNECAINGNSAVADGGGMRLFLHGDAGRPQRRWPHQRIGP
jgi:hypothetical protein